MDQQEKHQPQAGQVNRDREAFLIGLANNLSKVGRAQEPFSDDFLRQAEASSQAAARAWLLHPGMLPANVPNLLNRALLAVEVYHHPEVPGPMVMLTVQAPFAMPGTDVDLSGIANALAQEVNRVTMANAYATKTKAGRDFLKSLEPRLILP